MMLGSKKVTPLEFRDCDPSHGPRSDGPFMSDENPLRILEQWFEERRPVLELLGVDATFTPGSPERDKRAAWVDFSSPLGASRLILWESGEADLGIGIYTPGGFEEVLEEHREITSTVGLDDVEMTVKAWLLTGATDQARLTSG